MEKTTNLEAEVSIVDEHARVIPEALVSEPCKRQGLHLGATLADDEDVLGAIVLDKQANAVECSFDCEVRGVVATERRVSVSLWCRSDDHVAEVDADLDGKLVGGGLSCIVKLAELADGTMVGAIKVTAWARSVLLTILSSTAMFSFVVTILAVPAVLARCMVMSSIFARFMAMDAIFARCMVMSSIFARFMVMSSIFARFMVVSSIFARFMVML